MWEAGRLRSDALRYVLVLQGVMRWSGEAIEVIQQLAKGYGQEEIATKLDLVVVKLKEYSS